MAQRFEACERAVLVRPHQPRIPRHIGRQSVLNPLPAHPSEAVPELEPQFPDPRPNALRTGKHPTRRCSRCFPPAALRKPAVWKCRSTALDVEMGGRLPFGVDERGGVGIRLERAAVIAREATARPCGASPHFSYWQEELEGDRNDGAWELCR